MSDKEISYKIHNDKYLLFLCEKDKHSQFIQEVNGKWNSKLDGYVISKKHENKIQYYINSLKPRSERRSFTINNMKINIKSRKSQKKYHRAISESEDNSEDEKSYKSSKYSSSDSEDEKSYKSSKYSSSDSEDEKSYKSSKYSSSNYNISDSEEENSINDSDSDENS